jgi:uncharacterized protein
MRSLAVLPRLSRRQLCAAAGCAVLGASAEARVNLLWASPAWDGPVLNAEQSRVLRAWIVRLVDAQIARGPTPRWTHRDCAGLLRFAVAEALREHDAAWKRASGLDGMPLPPAIEIDAPTRQALRHRWRLSDGSTAAYAGAIDIVQGNSRFAGKDWQRAQAGDLLFFDQGAEQHLMVWMGRHVAYHTGQHSAQDSGLRAVKMSDLLQWRDTRWQPHPDNPNFAGVFQLAFLSR